MKLDWEIVHDCDDDNGNPTCYATEINHPNYGRFCWITYKGYFAVEVGGCYGTFTELTRCKSLVSAKRWVATYLIKR